MIVVRPSTERGAFDHGWLDTRHTFSFGEYQDRAHSGFRALRVINEDRVAAAEGFGTHGHRDMEILSYVVSGALAHHDSMGNGSTIAAGAWQQMSAGLGVTHSEHNPSPDEPAHFYQVWVRPDASGHAPRYAELSAEATAARSEGKLGLVASPDGRDGSMPIHQDATVWLARLRAAGAVEHPLAPGRGAWVQVVRGEVRLEAAGEAAQLAAGDGAALEGVATLRVSNPAGPAEVLLFDLA
ncbi:MAG: pirin family protein [Lacipirellulaceae bacterium]